MTIPTQARAVFSTEDFRLIRTAIMHYAQNNRDDAAVAKYAHLLHRLGRVG